MRPVLAVLVACTALAALAGLALLLPGSAEMAAIPHDRFAPMLVAGAPAGPDVRLVGVVVALLTVIAMASAVVLGLARAPRRVVTTVIGLFAGYALVVVMMIVSQTAYEAGARTFVLGFPAPTAWLVIGVWLYPWIIVAYLLSGFSHWYYSDEDEARFREIVAARRSASEHA